MSDFFIIFTASCCNCVLSVFGKRICYLMLRCYFLSLFVFFINFTHHFNSHHVKISQSLRFPCGRRFYWECLSVSAFTHVCNSIGVYSKPYNDISLYTRRTYRAYTIQPASHFDARRRRRLLDD